MVKDYGACSCGGRIHPMWFFGKKYLSCVKCGNEVLSAESFSAECPMRDVIRDRWGDSYYECGSQDVKVRDIPIPPYSQLSCWKCNDSLWDEYGAVGDAVAEQMYEDDYYGHEHPDGDYEAEGCTAYRRGADPRYECTCKRCHFGPCEGCSEGYAEVDYTQRMELETKSLCSHCLEIHEGEYGPNLNPSPRKEWWEAESKKLPPVEKAIDTGIASGATMEGLDLALTAEDFNAETERWIRIPHSRGDDDFWEGSPPPFYGKGYGKKRIFPNEQEARRDYEKLLREQPEQGWKDDNIGVECGCGNFVLREVGIWNHRSDNLSWGYPNYPNQVFSQNVHYDRDKEEPTSEEWEFATRWKEGEKNIVEIEYATKDHLEFERLTYMPMKMLEAEMEPKTELCLHCGERATETCDLCDEKECKECFDEHLIECRHCDGEGEVPRSWVSDSGDRWNPPTLDVTDYEPCEYCDEGQVCVDADVPEFSWDAESFAAECFQCTAKGVRICSVCDEIVCVDCGTYHDDECGRWDEYGQEIREADTYRLGHRITCGCGSSDDVIHCSNCNDNICGGHRCGSCGNCNTSDCCECSHTQAAESNGDLQLDESKKRTKMSAIRTGLAITTFGIVLWNLWTNKKQERQISDIMGLV